MTRRRHAGLPFIALALALSGAAHANAEDCEQAAQLAELESNLPHGLLLAVGQVESGRWDSARQRTAPWPWTIDVAGEGRFFPDRDSAVRAAQIVLQQGQRNIDLGCFQISLLHHPKAFADLNEAFAPLANARYAAQFLSALYQRYGTWPAAVAAYHSADPLRGEPYRDMVLAAWQPAHGLASPIPAVHVWTPGAVSGTGPQVISLRPSAAALPRVITPSR
jgi:hypothetical protein